MHHNVVTSYNGQDEHDEYLTMDLSNFVSIVYWIKKHQESMCWVLKLLKKKDEQVNQYQTIHLIDTLAIWRYE